MSNMKEALANWDAADELLSQKIDAVKDDLSTDISNVNKQWGLPSGMTLTEFAERLYAQYGYMRSYRIGLASYTESGVFSSAFGFAEIHVRNVNLMTIIVHVTNTTSNHGIIYKRSKSDSGWGSWYKFTGTVVS